MTSKVDEESLLLEAPSTSKSFKRYAPKVAGALVVALCLGALAAATVSSSSAVESVRKRADQSSRRLGAQETAARQAFETAARARDISTRGRESRGNQGARREL